MKRTETCDHCWHHDPGPHSMVLRPGQVVRTCCKCHDSKVEHRDHAKPGWLP